MCRQYEPAEVLNGCFIWIEQGQLLLRFTGPGETHAHGTIHAHYLIQVSIHAPVRGATVAEATKSLCASRVSFPRCGAYNHPFLPISKTMPPTVSWCQKRTDRREALGASPRI